MSSALTRLGRPHMLGAREKITEHHAGRAASGDTALNTAAVVKIHVAVYEPPKRDR